MNTMNMNMPGFTAEDSLYISSTQYNLTTPKFLVPKADIRLQIRPESGLERLPGGTSLRGRWPLTCESWCNGSTLWCICRVPGTGWASLFPCGTCIDDPILTA
ncbi:hypothetical protein SAMN05216417_1146 [Nitrosospira multiformis]|uniref:Uncharacterized protein n=1 Tax=Nitrosospira multiformis TaxID=1231 RepID=A0A1I7I383_9PROT|nr:hypothetical protein SAMN05216417_1146 [Nitrosospira multiformis]